MDKKTDVKAMMARFQAANTDETSSSTPAGRTKQPLQPTLSSGMTIQTKKPVLESLSGSAINHPPKPSFLKNTVATKSTTAVHEPNKTMALAGRFANIQDENNTNSKPLMGNKQHIPMKPPPLQPPEDKDQVEKPPLIKPSISSTLSNTKPAFPKPSPTAKPSWIKEDSGGGVPSTTSFPPKIPPSQQKPSSSLIKLWQQNEEQTGTTTDAANKPSPPTFKVPGNFKTPQDILNKEDKNDQPDSDGVKNTSSKPPPKPPASKKPSMKRPSRESQPNSSNSEFTLGPKRNPLPNSLALGTAPAKPNRPPRVNLENFKKGAEASDNGPGTFKNTIIPTLPHSSHPSNHNNYVTPPPPPPPQAALPSLPPRHPGSMIQQEDFYDDLDELNSSAPPPLPPPTGHPSQRAKEDNSDDDGEMEEKKKAKKRLEAEKKEQKEREKKEQEIRKKFKLVGPIEVIHQGTAYEDCKGSKTDLGLKQGDSLDIIRVQGNPEGKWLGRMQDGSIGYVKTTSVKIDFNSLKNHQAQQEYDPEVYDDIETVSSENSGTKGPGVVLPPLPGDGEEIYDDVVNPNLDVSPLDNRFSSTKTRSFLRMFERSNRPVTTKDVPPPSQFTAQGNSDQAGGEEIYDDVDSPNMPPPLPSFPILKGKSKIEEVDQKKQKKLEKEEKDFRKKFKYDGEIQVLHQVTIVHSLTNKKWSGKELPLKAGETLDVIVKAVDNKLVCRNEEGKFGYVSTCYIVSDDGDIYDDIGDDCIYDND
ncbi:FYN-binding protein 1 isoform X2 [Solea solea]|uniref:FYN-binding protein 1 isoform X2 n=1 Tax=Solea solea TaxID=90069 RepID=UPI00272CFB42|nr:FYN-binding protein 1 isoform X2 [Solea solea]